MFKNITIYRIVTDFFPELDEHEALLRSGDFLPCLPSQDKSAGWAPPREENGAMVESIDGQRITEFVIERKVVPGSAVVERAQAAADHIEATTGRKPGKKEMKELREDALQSLLPQAFPRRVAVPVWVDLKAGLVVVGSTSQSHLDEIVTSLVRTFQGLSLASLQTQHSPQKAMSEWLSTLEPEDDLPEGFTVGRACALKSADESKATVKFDHHYLHTEEVRKHITEGKLPVSLALEWEGRVAFTLTEGGRLKGIGFLDGVFDDRPGDDESGFDTDVVLATGELRKLIPALIGALGGALGGEVEHKAE